MIETLTMPVQTTIRRFVVLTAACTPSANCWGIYRRIAVVETDGVHMPKQINPRHKSVVSIRWERNNLNVGSTAKCAYQKALVEAEQIAAELNGSV